MIKVKKINGEEIVLNAELMESIKSTPDTIITLTTGKKVLVEENVDEVIDKVIQYKRRIFSHLQVKEE